MKPLFIIGIGGFIGSIARYLLSNVIQNKFIASLDAGYPFGTLGVNILGCFVIGIIYGYSLKYTLTFEWRIFLITGICGGFTTFSAFSVDLIKQIQQGDLINAFTYMLGSILLGLGATWSGILLMKL